MQPLDEQAKALGLSSGIAIDPEFDSANVPLRGELKSFEWWVRRLVGKIQEICLFLRPTLISIAVASSRLKPMRLA